MKASVHFCAYLNQIFVGVKNISHKSCREKLKILHLINFFQKSFFYVIKHYAYISEFLYVTLSWIIHAF
jgi:hypothetical protein